ncbi:MAG: hypothetical protein Q8M31_22670, partial [Beijerinckiaceae bacterium]|nr:hypothetical protein [Beijerinckiaceae bacterium]
IALFQWAIKEKLSYLQTVIDAGALGSFVEMSTKTIPLGLSHPYGGGRGVTGGGECIAIRWPVGQHVIDDVLEYVGWPDLPEHVDDVEAQRVAARQLAFT